jgi:hypothetical protein
MDGWTLRARSNYFIFYFRSRLPEVLLFTPSDDTALYILRPRIHFRLARLFDVRRIRHIHNRFRVVGSGQWYS